MKSLHYFEAFVLWENKIESDILLGESAREIKQRLHQHWRENEMYDAKVVRIVPSTEADFNARYS